MQREETGRLLTRQERVLERLWAGAYNVYLREGYRAALSSVFAREAMQMEQEIDHERRL